MTTSNMVTLMLHGTILVLTLITGAVHSMENTYWSNGRMRQELGQYQVQDENKRFDKEYRETPVFQFSTIIQMKEFKRHKMTAEIQNLKRYFI